jgi:DNA-binding SARP family transcriptional activator
MGLLSVQMLGRLYLSHDDTEITSLETRKSQELLCYLLLHRQRAHPREALANVFWSNTPTVQSRANLRKTLWQLQNALGDRLAEELLQVDAAWVQINPNASIWLDVAVIEQSFAQVRGSCGEEMSDDRAQIVSSAVALYRGELLDGWYQDWCLFERERLQNIYLSLLDRLMGYCEYHQEYERGLAYGTELLQYDRTREQTYCRMMRLHVRAGNRASALRQYDRCVAVLLDELDIEPSAPTAELYERIRDNRSLEGDPSSALTEGTTIERTLREVLTHLRGMQCAAVKISQTIDEEIGKIEGMVRQRTR